MYKEQFSIASAMKVKVLRVRVWKFIRLKRNSSISFLARLFGKKSSSSHSGVLRAPDRNHLQTSIVGEQGWYNDTEFEEPGPAITKRRSSSSLGSFRGKSEQQALVRKVHSKRHNMQVIAMWNPAASVTTVEAPVESSPKIWFRQASKNWKEHGSGRLLLDPIENGPESSQDWRSRFVDIDPDHRWPVQG